MAPFDDTYGAFLIGVVIAAVLYGCICIQTWYYYTHYPSDRWYIKLLVAGVVFSETLDQALIIHAIYTYVVTHFGDPNELKSVLLSPILGIICTGFSTLFVQSFLTTRIYRLSQKNWFATGLAMIMVAAQFVITMFNAIKALSVHTFEQLVALQDFIVALGAISAAGDVVIALTLCVLLQKSRTGFRRSEALINRLIMFSLNTSLLTSFCAVGSLVSIAAWPRAFFYLVFYFSVGRLYANSFLAVLNTRNELISEMHNDISFIQETELERISNRAALGSSSKRATNNIFIKVDTTREYVREENSFNSDKKSPEVV